MSITVRRSEDDEDALDDRADKEEEVGMVLVDELEVEVVEVEAGGTIEGPIWIGTEPESTLVDPLLLPSRMRPKFPHMVEAV